MANAQQYQYLIKLAFLYAFILEKPDVQPQL